MDMLKEAFSKVKQDIDLLKSELDEIKRTLKEISAQTNKTPTNQQSNPTNQQSLEALKSQILTFSTGNGGVPTDRQTDQQTDQHINYSELLHLDNKSKSAMSKDINSLEKMSELLESLDSIKKDLRITFKRLTTQEMAIFTALYQLDEQGFTVDYTLLSQKFNLTESSIRDYIQRIIKKGVPVDKTKENNKKVTLSVSQDLKKIATLSTILQLRNL